jgi:phage tail P2-like protein
LPANSILPPNATLLLKDWEAATSSRLSLLDGGLRYLNNPDLCPAHILPWLAWAVSVDVWSDDWTEQQKRAVIRQSIQVHKQKGTLGALKRALTAFAYAKTDIREWFEYGGDPFSFRAVIQFIASGASVRNCQEIYETIMQTKNLRSWLEAISAELETINATPNLALRFGYEETICVYPRE